MLEREQSSPVQGRGYRAMNHNIISDSCNISAIYYIVTTVLQSFLLPDVLRRKYLV